MGIHATSDVLVTNDKTSERSDVNQVEHAPPSSPLPVIDGQDEDLEVEPDFHARTWLALAAFFLLNYVQVVALQGPSAVVCITPSRRFTACC